MRSLDTVSTTCGSGWVAGELAILKLEIDPPATAGGTDRIQQGYLICE